MSRPPMTRWVALAAVLALGGCGHDDDDDDHEGEVRDVSAAVCASGLQWAGGDEESPEMYPGRDCVGCHSQEHEGPLYAAAGTVYGAYDEADDCFGVGGVLVEIIDANGNVTSSTTNGAGNFWVTSNIAPPITARVTSANGTLEMLTPATSANCPTCHTATGANGAAGRIVAP